MKRIRLTVPVAISWFAMTMIASLAHGQGVAPVINASVKIAPRVKRVWTNDDFAQAVPKPVAAVEVKKTEAPVVPVASAPSSSPEAELARKEVVSEMLSTAQLRQRAYESNLSEIRNKMQVESSAFRRQIYERFIRDVEALSASNQILINQLSSGDKPATPAVGK